MTFADLDALLAFFEQIANDRMREFATNLLTRDPDDLTDDIGDIIDGAYEWHDEQMVEWRIATRRQLEAMPLRFSLTVRWEDARRGRTDRGTTCRVGDSMRAGPARADRVARQRLP